MRSPDFKAYVALAVVCFFWGTTYLATSVAVTTVHGFFLAGVRQTLAGLIMAGFFLLRGHPFPKGAELMRLIWTGILMVGISNGFMNWSLQHIPSGIGAILAATTPIWMVAFGAMTGVKTRLSWTLVLGILVGLAGIAGIFRDYVAELLNPDFRMGIVLGLASTMTWCLGSVLTIRKKLSTHIIFGSGVQLIAAGVSMFLLSAATSGIGGEVFFRPVGWTFYASLSYLVGIGSIITFTSYVYALTHLPPAKVSIYSYVNPIVAVLAGAAILGEKLTLNTLAFSLVTVAGVWLVNRSKS